MYTQIRLPYELYKSFALKKTYHQARSWESEKPVQLIFEGLKIDMEKGKIIRVSKALYNHFVAEPDGEYYIAKVDVVGKLSERSVTLKITEETNRKTKLRRALQNDPEVMERRKVAQEIADKYSRYFLGMRKFEMRPASRTMKKFMKAAERLEEFSKMSAISKADVLKYVMKIFLDTFTNTGRKVYPANFASDTLWDIQLPQHIREIIPGFNFDKQGDKEKILTGRQK